MKIILIGALDNIGNGGSEVLSSEHEIIEFGYSTGDFQVDISVKKSIEKLFQDVDSFDAVICAAGWARFCSLEDQPDEDYTLALTNKLMGQVDLVRVGQKYISDNGSFSLTGGMLSQHPSPRSASVRMVNGGIENFVRAAALGMKRGIRVNAVSPLLVKETAEAKGTGSAGGISASKIDLAYKESVEGKRNGEVLNGSDFA